MYNEEQYEQPLDTCSELNYNMNYNNDECYDSYGYNQQWQNGDVNSDPYGYSNNKKTLPQPPISYSQSVNDGFVPRLVVSNEHFYFINVLRFFRGASLPATPISQQRYNRQLPKYTSPTHQSQSQSRGLPKLSRQLPSSIENAASTFSSLFGVGRSAKTENEHEPQKRSLFSLLSESKPQASQKEIYLQQNSYNENYNYAYHSIDSNDELMVIEEKFDGDNSDLADGRLGAALPILPLYENPPSLDYDVYG